MAPLGLGQDMAKNGGDVLKMWDNEPSGHNPKIDRCLYRKKSQHLFVNNWLPIIYNMMTLDHIRINYLA